MLGCSESAVEPSAQDQWIVVNTNLTYNPRFMFTDVFFPTPQNGWIVGGFSAYNGGSIIHTSDGGKSWSVQIDGTSPGLKSVYFFNNIIGWAAGGEGTILKTEDGGSFWNIITINKDIDFTDLFFWDELSGWAAGSDEAIYFTSDGGNTWELQRSGNEFGLQSIFFIDTLNGWAIGNFYGFSERGVILKTSNGGANWEQQLITPPEINVWEIKFFDKSNGWISCSKGKFYKTNNGGNSWELINTGTENSIYSFEFADAKNGWAVGLLQTFLSSNDSGITWSLINPLYGNWQSRVMQSITFADPRNAWIVGSDGFIVHFIRKNGI